MRNHIGRAVPWLLGITMAFAQTAVDLRTQSKNVDFSNVVGTKPFQIGNVLPSTCVTGQMFFLTAAPGGSNLYGCTAANIWSLESGGSGSGATSAGQLADFLVTRTSPTTLAIGAACSASTPCNIRFGSQVYSFATGGTATISGGSGVAYIYISSGGVLTVGHNVTAICPSGCAAQGGVTSFPLDAIPLFTWTASNGTWDAAGGVDRRAFLSSQILAVGAGLQLVQTAGQNTVAADPSVVGMRVAKPTTSTSACVTGTWAADSSFYYICVNTNSWVRAALSSF
ncbi:MAG TPA: hypothetical protein VMJ34_03680 [Bryobacteraceae bacterium]|nr:hypothetical protein [Bryobacteraceae bacterium]